MKRLVVFAMASSMALSTAPAYAQYLTPAEREQAYQNCRQEFVARGMGNDDAANEYCTNIYYNEEPWSPPPYDPCTINFTLNCTQPY